MVSGESKDVAKVMNVEFGLVEMLGDAFNVEHAVFWEVIGEDTFFINIFPASFKVYQSNSIIEYAFNLLYLA